MSLKIEILCSSPDHPVNPWLYQWMEGREGIDHVSLVHNKAQLGSGDLLFLISVSEIIGQDILGNFKNSAVIHASDLPKGRGWSPHVWSILSGAQEIVVSALVAAEPVDSGPIWTKKSVLMPPHWLHDEINAALFRTSCEAMTRVCEMVSNGEAPRPQPDGEITYWRRRTPSDSMVDPNASIESQFDLLRVCDPDRYPAFFELRGHTYTIRLEKRGNDD
jgi:methionyl-tRNA formyltransferase